MLSDGSQIIQARNALTGHVNPINSDWCSMRFCSYTPSSTATCVFWVTAAHLRKAFPKKGFHHPGCFSPPLCFFYLLLKSQLFIALPSKTTKWVTSVQLWQFHILVMKHMRAHTHTHTHKFKMVYNAMLKFCKWKLMWNLVSIWKTQKSAWWSHSTS